MIEITDVAYAAGIVDGEGTIGIGCSFRHSKSGKETKVLKPHISVSNTNQEIIEWLVSTFGGYSVPDKRYNTKWKMAYIWYISDRDKAWDFLLLVKPYVKIKRRQLDLMLGFLALDERPAWKVIGSESEKYSNLIEEIQYNYYLDMKELNRKGAP